MDNYRFSNSNFCVCDRLFIEKEKVERQLEGRENQPAYKYVFRWSSFFLSALGLLWGIVAGSPDTAFGVMLYKATLTMGAAYFAVAAVAVIMSLIFRKKGRIKASIWANIIAFAYITVVLIVNSIADKML